MELLAQSIAPIVSLWVIHNAIFSSAEFVNKMRETVISGVYGERELTPEHRHAILQDWRLCVAGTVFVCLIFGGIVVAISLVMAPNLLMTLLGLAIASYPFACAFGFAKCSRLDGKLMREAIAKAAKAPTLRK